MINSGASSKQWRFFRAGGFDQVKLETGSDLMALDQLDLKLWVALACPTSGLEFDKATLALIDTDKDGRVRAPELIAAVQWAGSMLKNPDDLIKGGDSVALAGINDGSPEGKQILAAAKQILGTLGHKEAGAISVAEATDGSKLFAETLFNGDGVIPLESADDEETKAVLNAILECIGAVTDHSGKPGIDQAKADAFFGECAALDVAFQRRPSAVVDFRSGAARARYARTGLSGAGAVAVASGRQDGR